jgi:purine-cytosine permease-like protein
VGSPDASIARALQFVDAILVVVLFLVLLVVVMVVVTTLHVLDIDAADGSRSPMSVGMEPAV